MSHNMRPANVSTRVMLIWHTLNYRCTKPSNQSYKYYGGKGIKNLITPTELQFLWDRDGAGSMVRPSINRKHSDGHYILDNCQFMELLENIAKGSASTKSGRSKEKVHIALHHFKREGTRMKRVIGKTRTVYNVDLKTVDAYIVEALEKLERGEK